MVLTREAGAPVRVRCPADTARQSCVQRGNPHLSKNHAAKGRSEEVGSFPQRLCQRTTRFTGLTADGDHGSDDEAGDDVHQRSTTCPRPTSRNCPACSRSQAEAAAFSSSDRPGHSCAAQAGRCGRALSITSAMRRSKTARLSGPPDNKDTSPRIPAPITDHDEGRKKRYDDDLARAACHANAGPWSQDMHEFVDQQSCQERGEQES